MQKNIIESFSPSYDAQLKFEANKKARILLVEDDKPMRMIISDKLERLGHETLEAHNGQHAIEVLFEEKNKERMDSIKRADT